MRRRNLKATPANPLPRISRLRCILSENEVVSLVALVAWKATLHRVRAGRFSVWGEGAETPTASRRVLFRVLDHELNVGGLARSERLLLAENLVVFGIRGVSVVQGGDDSAVGERKGLHAVGLNGDIVAQHGAQTVKAASLMRNVDESVVAISHGHLDNVRRCSLCTCLLRCAGLMGGNSGH